MATSHREQLLQSGESKDFDTTKESTGTNAREKEHDSNQEGTNELCTTHVLDREGSESRGSNQHNSIKEDGTYINEVDHGDAEALRSNQTSKHEGFAEVFSIVKQLVWIAKDAWPCESKTSEFSVYGGEGTDKCKAKANCDKYVIGIGVSPLERDFKNCKSHTKTNTSSSSAVNEKSLRIDASTTSTSKLSTYPPKYVSQRTRPGISEECRDRQSVGHKAISSKSVDITRSDRKLVSKTASTDKHRTEFTGKPLARISDPASGQSTKLNNDSPKLTSLTERTTSKSRGNSSKARSGCNRLQDTTSDLKVTGDRGVVHEVRARNPNSRTGCFRTQGGKQRKELTKLNSTTPTTRLVGLTSRETNDQHVSDVAVMGVTGGHVNNAYTAGVVHGDVGQKSVTQVYQPGSMITQNQIISDHVTVTEGVHVDREMANRQGQIEERLEMHDIPFIETTGYLQAKNCLESSGLVTLIGEAGSGKTTIGYRLLKFFKDSKSFTPLIVDEVDELKHLRDPKEPTLVFVDDIFGISAYSVAKLQMWLPVFRQLQTTFRKFDKLKLIFSSRNYIFKEAMPNVILYQDVLFSENTQIDLSGDATLLQPEKERLLRGFSKMAGIFIKEEDLKSIVEMKTTYGFPHACYMFSKMKKWHTRPLTFFKKPVDIMIESVQHLSQLDKNKFAILLLVLLNDGKFKLSKLRKDDDMLKAVHDYTSFQRISELVTRRHQLASPLIGSYLTSTRDTLSFRHPTVEDTVAYVVGSIDPLFLIQHCSMQVLYERVRIHSSTGQGSTEPTQPDTQWFHVILSDDYHDDLVNRFVAEFQEDHFALVCLHRACSDRNFVCKLFAKLDQRAQSFKEIIFHRTDAKHRQTFLQWSVMNPSEALCEKVLKEAIFSLLEKNNAIITCCVTGNSKALESLINALNPLAKQLITKFRVKKLDMMVIQDTEEISIQKGPVNRYSLMHVACNYGHRDVVAVLIKSGFALESDEDYESPLHCCCRKGHASVVRLLVEQGANLEVKHSYWEETPLHMCSQFGHFSALKQCLEKGANIEAKDIDGKTPLFNACRFGHERIAEYLIEHGADKEVKDYKGSTPLIEACLQGHCSVVHSLLIQGADLEAKCYLGRTPLIEACGNGHISVANVLIENGASTKDIDETLLQSACQGGCTDIAKDLLSKRRPSMQNVKSKRKVSLLHCVATKIDVNREDSKCNIAKLLIENGANVNIVDENNMTPLMVAAENGYRMLAKLFIERGDPVIVKDSSGQTLLHKAAKGDMVDIIGVLASVKATVTHGETDGEQPLSRPCPTPSHCLENADLTATEKHSLPQVGQILDSDILSLVNTEDDNMETPLHVAALFGSYASVKALLVLSADIGAINKDKQTPLHLAAQRHDVNGIKVLIDNGAMVDSKVIKMKTPLHIAAECGTVDMVQMFINKKGKVNDIDHKQRTPLHKALQGRKNDIALLLLNNGADVNVDDKRGQTPLHMAAEYGNIDTLEKILDMIADVNAKDQSNQTPLHLATLRPTADNVQVLVNNKADVNAVDVYGMTPLHHAAMLGKADTVQILIENKAEVDAIDDNQQTPLHLATMDEKALYTVFILLENNADINARDSYRRTPLHIAASRCCAATTVQFLLDNEANVGLVDVKMQTPLHIAANMSDLSTIMVILKDNNCVNTKDLKQQTALHIAVTSEVDMNRDLRQKEAGCAGEKTANEFILDIVQVLLNNKADVNAVDGQHQTPLHLAIRINRAEIVQLLLKYNADINITDDRKRTPLHLAVISERLDILQMIIDTNIDVNARDGGGGTPLHLAATKMRTDISQLLLDRGADANARNFDKRTPLHVAAYDMQIQVLLDSSADINATDVTGLTPLHFASVRKPSAPMNILLQNEADISKTNTQGQTALHLAAEKGYSDKVEMLLNKMADVNARDCAKQTPLHMAAKGEMEFLRCIVDNLDMNSGERGLKPHLKAKIAKAYVFKHAVSCELLLRCKADVNATDERTKTPLHLAAETGTCDIIQVLLDNGADVNAVDDGMNTPLQLAQQCHRTEIVDSLLGVKIHDSSVVGPILALPP